MKSIDTNVVVRLLAEDDPRQTLLAKAVLHEGAFITAGVFMETEWVLRSRYRWSRERINNALTQLTCLDTVVVKDRDLLLWCLERHRQKADLADMLHIISSRDTPAFVTFEDEMAKEAGPETPVPVMVLK